MSWKRKAFGAHTTRENDVGELLSRRRCLWRKTKFRSSRDRSSSIEAYSKKKTLHKPYNIYPKTDLQQPSFELQAFQICRRERRKGGSFVDGAPATAATPTDVVDANNVHGDARVHPKPRRQTPRLRWSSRARAGASGGHQTKRAGRGGETIYSSLVRAHEGSKGRAVGL